MANGIKPPRGERIWTTWYNIDGSAAYVITSKDTRDYYYIYAVGSDGSLTKLGKARTPPELEEKYVGRPTDAGGPTGRKRGNVGKADIAKTVDT